jgi:hypothetical protein
MSEIETGKIAVENVLAHFGKKGMKWGVRQDKGHEGERAKTRKINRLDRQFEKGANPKYIKSVHVAVKIHNRAADLTNKHDIDRINNKPEYKDADFRRDSPLRQKYYKEHQDAFLKNVEKAAEELGTNATGTRKYVITETRNGGWDIHTDSVRHADTSNSDAPLFTVKVNYNNGRIVSIELPDEVAHGEAFAADVLAHVGVKGMHWGVRKSREERSAASKVMVKTKPAVRGAQDVKVKNRAGKPVLAKGGKRNLGTEDAVRTVATRQKAKASSTDALTNHELKAAVERMQLEVKFKDLEKKSKRQMGIGQRFAEAFLGKDGGAGFTSVAQAIAKG